MEYNFISIEEKWQRYWREKKVYSSSNNSDLPKYYVLDMFPYPSGSGLHVGHPLGYIASDIISRYKRTKGFNVLHPMGFDSFGLPAEQYAIKTGQHPKITTENNIVRFKEQLNKLGLSYDWDREIKTSDSSYYKWTQWIFLKLYNSYFDKEKNKAVNIDDLKIPKGLENDQINKFIDSKRLAYIDTIDVNWCEELGTVLANEEVIGGLSERGGHPVIRKPMKQWVMRITDYADRLLEDLEDLDEEEFLEETEDLREMVEGKLVLVGDTSEMSHDIFETPVGEVYGIEIIADTVATMMKQQPIRPATFAFEALVMLILLLAFFAVSQLKKFENLVFLLVIVVYSAINIYFYIYKKTFISFD